MLDDECNAQYCTKFSEKIGWNFQRNISHGLMHSQIFVRQINAESI
jgi:hypothetical protein